MPLNGYSMRPHDTQCKGPWPTQSKGDEVLYYDQWVEPGQYRWAPPPKHNSLVLIIGPCDEQDLHQHDRTIRWLVLIDDRLREESLSEIGEWWLVYPTPPEA